MLSSLACAFLVVISTFSLLVSATPLFTYENNPLGNSFPDTSPDQLKNIQVQAHGSLSNGKPPPKVDPDTLTSLRFVAFNELFEVAFFTSLINNITNVVDGYQVWDPEARSSLIEVFTAIQAQEELHALNANKALKNFGADPIKPCKYEFPVLHLEEAIAVAKTFTDLVMGTLQDVAQNMAINGDAGFIRGVLASLGQEGEQNGFFRTLQGRIPSALPFLTTSTRDISFSALNHFFIVPGSWYVLSNLKTFVKRYTNSLDSPNADTISLNIFPQLAVSTQDTLDLRNNPRSRNLGFSFDIPEGGLKQEWKVDLSGLKLTYINMQNVPLAMDLLDVSVDGNKVSFNVLFPFDQGTFGNSLTIALIVSADANFTTAVTVTKASTVIGPALIQVN
jgi:hypothetical protein